MQKRMPTRFLLILMLLGLSACSTVPKSSTPQSLYSTQATAFQTVSLGSVIPVPKTGESLAGEARVLEEYQSASGRHCLRVEMDGENRSIRVMCERDNGEWSLTRALFDSTAPEEKEPLLMTTPLSTEDVNIQERAKINQSSVAEVIGVDFDTHLAQGLSFDGQNVWNYAGTVTAGPAKWSELALEAALKNAAEIVMIVQPDKRNEPITGRR